jgi:hypothetical protein
MFRNATLHRVVASFFLLELVSSIAALSLSYALMGPSQPEFTSYESADDITLTFPSIVACKYYLNNLLSNSQRDKQSEFIMSLAQDNQEIENHYIANASLYTRIIQYLNYDISQDVYLRLPGRPDSIAASAASYPRQYGATGRSSVLLTFPVPDKQLRHGCIITFKGEKLALGTHRFIFTAADIKTARKAPRPTN